VGRPKKPIDENLVAELAFEGSSNREIADIVGCDDHTIESRFSALLKKKRAERRAGLRRAQNREALAGVPSLLIWLGKQELGQVERVVHEGPSGPINVIIRRPDANPGSGAEGGDRPPE
jgi:hypothetical protein